MKETYVDTNGYRGRLGVVQTAMADGTIRCAKIEKLERAYIYVKETYIYVKETYIDTHGYLGRLGVVQTAMADSSIRCA